MEGRDSTGPGTAIVIGAGIVGTCCALHLQQRGFKVTVIDRAGPGEQCSFGNGGNLGYASCIPLATPGIWTRAPQMLFGHDGRSALPGRDCRGSRRGWHGSWRQAPRTESQRSPTRVRPCCAGSMTGYAPPIASAGAQDLIHQGGLLYTWESEEAFRRAAPRRAAPSIEIRRRCGATVRVLSGAEAREMEPALTPRVTYATFIPEVSQVVNPLRLTQTLIASFTRFGGALLREEVTGFTEENGSVQGVTTNAGVHRAALLVIAAGVWSGRSLRKLDWSVPAEAERGYHVMAKHPAMGLRMAVLSADRSIGATPMELGVRIVGITELAGLDRMPEYRHAKQVARLAEGLLPGLTNREGRALDGPPHVVTGLTAGPRAAATAPQRAACVRTRPYWAGIGWNHRPARGRTGDWRGAFCEHRPVPAQPLYALGPPPKFVVSKSSASIS
jgi:D-amino-acid dehydrogenase